MIDLTKPVYFTDDRSKSDLVVKLSEILWKDDKFCLCRVVDATEIMDKYNVDYSLENSSDASQLILFHIETEKVLVEDFMFWNASNNIDWWRPFGWDGD